MNNNGDGALIKALELDLLMLDPTRKSVVYDQDLANNPRDLVRVIVFAHGSCETWWSQTFYLQL